MAEIEQRALELQRARAACPNTVPGSLATVKPPRNRRTRLRPDTEHKDCSHG